MQDILEKAGRELAQRKRKAAAPSAPASTPRKRHKHHAHKHADDAEAAVDDEPAQPPAEAVPEAEAASGGADVQPAEVERSGPEQPFGQREAQVRGWCGAIDETNLTERGGVGQVLRSALRRKRRLLLRDALSLVSADPSFSASRVACSGRSPFRRGAARVCRSSVGVLERVAPRGANERMTMDDLPLKTVMIITESALAGLELSVGSSTSHPLPRASIVAVPRLAALGQAEPIRCARCTPCTPCTGAPHQCDWCANM